MQSPVEEHNWSICGRSDL